ncbi:MAG: FKBP-type peptidyl-prolyl cis-trans isomerase [Bacteroidetes bacterium]|nr:FKBP-type peptidyl-prolyl cis-trans isomerase [Bacteroidota bacterium]
MLILFIASSCNNGEQKKKTLRSKDLKEPLIEANKHVVKTEAQHIEDFLARYQWPAMETGSGLKIYIYDDKPGKNVQPGDAIVLVYSVHLINGTRVDSATVSSPVRFTAGKGEVISGLEEGILYLSEGDKAKIIIPSHLGYGLLGDLKKNIPPKATLIYDLELKNIAIQNKN